MIVLDILMIIALLGVVVALRKIRREVKRLMIEFNEQNQEKE